MTTQEQAIELLNAAKLAGDGSSKVPGNLERGSQHS
jgi:hypothetical protein